MKHSFKIILLLLGMFFITQLIGLLVVNAYAPKVTSIVLTNNSVINTTVYSYPYNLNPPTDVKPVNSLLSIITSLIAAVIIIFLLMKFKAENFLKGWFFLVIVLALSVTLFVPLRNFPYASILAVVISLPLTFLKVFKRNILVHNITEVLIYPGIASLFVPLFKGAIWAILALLIFISLYDMYAVWHAGFMQKMAKYQIQKLKIFSGFLVPYMSKKDKELISQAKKNKSIKISKIKMNLAILGGGDVVFPIILAGVVLATMGLWSALAVSIGATVGLAFLFAISQKGKFYPAMPFISAGCFIALGIAYLIS